MLKPDRISCLLILLIGTSVFGQGEDSDVNWLKDVQRPPTAEVNFDVGTMEPLLVLKDGTVVRNRADWIERRRELTSAWDEFLGPSLQTPVGTETQLLKRESVGDVVRELIRYECEPNLFVEAYLIRPSKIAEGGRLPGIVALHHTTPDTIDETAGVSGPESRMLGLKLARRGFIVICPRCFLWQDSPSLTQAVENFRTRHPKSLGMRKMLFDARRAVDILVSHSLVDRTRIGNSQSGNAVFGIKAAVASEGGTAFKSTNWDAPWYLGPQIHEPTFTRNHHELLALAAPRAFLVLGGESGPGAADGDRSWPLVSAALPVYKLYPVAPRLGLLNHGEGHTITDAVYERLAEWLETYLSPKAVAALNPDSAQVDKKQ